MEPYAIVYSANLTTDKQDILEDMPSNAHDDGWAAASSAYQSAGDGSDSALALANAPCFFTPRPKGRPKKPIIPGPVQDSQGELSIVALSDWAGFKLPELKFQETETDRCAITVLPTIQRQLLIQGQGLASTGSSEGPAAGDEVLDTLLKYVDNALHPSKPLASKTMLASVLGGPDYEYQEKVAAVLLESGHGQWSMLLKRCNDLIKAGKSTGLLLIKQRFYDETPLRLRRFKSDNHPSLNKLLQSHFHLGIVLQDQSSKEITFYHGAVPTWLQGLAEKNGEHIMEAQLALENSVVVLQESSLLFNQCIQLTTTDRDGSNHRAEAGINRLKPEWDLMHLPCDVHKASTATNNLFKLVPNMVTGIVNFGLLLRIGGSVQKFRRCIRDEIVSKLKVIVAPPPDGYVQDYRHQVYATYLQGNCSNEDALSRNQFLRVRQIEVLNFFLNGDLQDTNCIQWYAPYAIKHEDACKLLCRYVPFALLPRGVSVFPRHRWHGCEIPIDQLGLLAAHHNLLKSACLRYLNDFSDKPASSVTQLRPATGEGWEQAAESFVQHGPQTDSVEGNLVQLEAGADLLQQPDEASAVGGKPTNWDEFNRSVRARVREFVMQDDSFWLPILRFAISPLIGLMFAFLKLSGQEWENEQEEELLRNGSRNYRILKALLGEDLENALKDLFSRLHSPIPALPQVAHNRRSCILLFRLIARAAGSLHCLLRVVQSGFPYKLFWILLGKAGEVTDSRTCLQDPVTKQFVAKFGAKGLDCLEALACLHSLASMALVDIAQVEARHATIRRTLEFCSLNSKRATLQKLSADFTCRQSNLLREAWSKRLFKPEKVKKASGRRPKTAKKKRGGGGAFRAFVRDFLRARRPCDKKQKQQQQSNNMSIAMRAAAEEFHQLSPKQYAHYRDVGQAATLSHRTGHKAFGRKCQKKGQTPARDLSQFDLAVQHVEKALCTGRKRIKDRNESQASKRQRTESALTQFCRAGLQLSAEQCEITEDDAFLKAMELTHMPKPQLPHISQNWQIMPQNAKRAKDCVMSLFKVVCLYCN